ncbi:class I SAM-dependent methyltransferase [Amycolatopsis sp. OK19-0408]|uniref:Class I SAM-dependent methyltransferase n=1 Tax=Amycolatopsis iheyensis TaxID=2945988 RepID=A0A9X2NJ44_9PSEU|nr:class I SAM-dependent methyltransferase [Amycolatopsis iheyensis]MCR6488421.1 class I SAM-dependent methyltransferase [Amycolatopsis iheyensis]
MTKTPAHAATSYRDATAHYTSPNRRDPVKTMLEELVTHRVLGEAIRTIRPEPGEPLRVLDLGCGTGDGLSLLTEQHGPLPPLTDANTLEYVGVDVDPDMVDTARSLHAHLPATFEVADMRSAPPAGDFDLYMSSGVPYSHLPHAEVADVLTGLMRRIVETRDRAALVVDVLGRYSVEWTPQWPRTRWSYDMSFFEGAGETLHDQMSFFDRRSLDETLVEAATRAGARLCGTTFTDRSILAGRHTATLAFTKAIPPYRTLLNELARGTADVDPARLRFQVPEGEAPQSVERFFAAFAERWNQTITTSVGDGPGLRSPEHAKQLADALFECEQQVQQGLGVGHSLIANVVVERPTAA